MRAVCVALLALNLAGLAANLYFAATGNHQALNAGVAVMNFVVLVVLGLVLGKIWGVS